MNANHWIPIIFLNGTLNIGSDENDSVGTRGGGVSDLLKSIELNRLINELHVT